MGTFQPQRNTLESMPWDLTTAKTNSVGRYLNQCNPDDGHIKYVLPGAFCSLLGWQ